MLAMEAMVLGPQALLSAAMNPVLADFSPVLSLCSAAHPSSRASKLQ